MGFWDIFGGGKKKALRAGTIKLYESTFGKAGIALVKEQKDYLASFVSSTFADPASSAFDSKMSGPMGAEGAWFTRCLGLIHASHGASMLPGVETKLVGAISAEQDERVLKVVQCLKNEPGTMSLVLRRAEREGRLSRKPTLGQKEVGQTAKEPTRPPPLRMNQASRLPTTKSVKILEEICSRNDILGPTANEMLAEAVTDLEGSGETGSRSLAILLHDLVQSRNRKIGYALVAAASAAPTPELTNAVRLLLTEAPLKHGDRGRFDPEISGDGQIGWSDGTHQWAKKKASEALEKLRSA